MVIGALEVRLMIIGARSLKEKRKVLKSLKDRFSRMNISIAEVDDHDKWQACTLAFSFVSNDAGFVNSVLDRIIQGLGDNDEIEILGTRTEIIHL